MFEYGGHEKMGEWMNLVLVVIARVHTTYDATSQLYELHHDHKCALDSYVNNDKTRLTPTPSRRKNSELQPKPMV